MNSEKGATPMNRLRPFLFLLLSLPATSYPPPLNGKTVPLEDVHHRNLCQAAEQEKISPAPEKGLGTQDLSRTDGGKDKTYYSITTPEEEARAKQEEKESADRSWEMLRNIIIDRRNR